MAGRLFAQASVRPPWRLPAEAVATSGMGWNELVPNQSIYQRLA